MNEKYIEIIKGFIEGKAEHSGVCSAWDGWKDHFCNCGADAFIKEAEEVIKTPLEKLL